MPYLAFAGCASIWGSTFLFIRLSNAALPPLWASTMRLVLAGAILTGVMLASRVSFPRGEGLRAAALYGLLNFGISFPLLYWGETELPSGLAAVLYATAPISAMLIARAYGLERLDGRRLLAAVAALGGVAIIFWREIAHGLAPWPILSVLGAAMTSTLAVIVLKRGPKQSPFGTNAVGALVGAPVCFALSLGAREPQPLPLRWDQLGPLLYLTLAGSIGAFVLLAWLVSRWKASSVSFIAVVVPVIAVALGGIFLGERFAPGSAVGAAVVLVATAFVIRSEAKHAS